MSLVAAIEMLANELWSGASGCIHDIEADITSEWSLPIRVGQPNVASFPPDACDLRDTPRSRDLLRTIEVLSR
jgi:hypothetical protein